MVIKSGQKGFTIVELLIVVVVIGILAAITLASLLKQKTQKLSPP